MIKSNNSNSVINIVLPRQHWDVIQHLRSLYSSDLKCGPHVTILDPFVLSSCYNLAEKKALAELKSIPPFTITLDKINHFEHNSTCTIYAEPTTEPANALQVLHKALLKAFPMCTDTLRHGSFTPHMSLGKVKKANFSALKAKIQKMWKPISFTMQEVYFLERSGDPSDTFEVKRIIPLGSKVPAAVPFFTVEPAESKTSRTVCVSNLPRDLLDTQLHAMLATAKIAFTAAEMICNPDGRARGIAVVEFASTQEAIDASYNAWNEPVLLKAVKRPLQNLVYPDVVGGTSNVKAAVAKFA